ncbi:MAG: pilus assembly protein PilM [Pseudomonadota bacterium]
MTRRPHAGVASLCIHDQAVAFAYVVRRPNDRPLLVQAETRPATAKNVEEILHQLVSKHRLNRIACTTLLAHNDYKLLITEAPEVGANELKSALKWRVKDLLDMPISEVTLDAFKMPQPPGAQQRSVYVVAGFNKAIASLAKRMEECSANLVAIDIPELAQRNIGMLSGFDAQGAAVLSFQAAGGLITVSKGGELYLSRRIATGMDILNALPKPAGDGAAIQYDARRAAVFDQVVLELQRSLDFYESNFRQAPIRRLLLATGCSAVDGLAGYLQSSLGLEVRALDFTEALECAVPLTDKQQSELFFAIGAALREDAP